MRASVGGDHQDHAQLGASSHDCALRPGRRVKEVPGAETPLLALDEQSALTRHDEERLLIRLGVVDAALAGSSTMTLIPNCATRSETRRARWRTNTPHPLVSEENHSASRTLTTDQP